MVKSFGADWLKDIVKSGNLPDCSFEWHPDVMACFIFISYFSVFFPVFLPVTAVQERDRMGEISR